MYKTKVRGWYCCYFPNHLLFCPFMGVGLLGIHLIWNSCWLRGSVIQVTAFSLLVQVPAAVQICSSSSAPCTLPSAQLTFSMSPLNRARPCASGPSRAASRWWSATITAGPTACPAASCRSTNVACAFRLRPSSKPRDQVRPSPLHLFGFRYYSVFCFWENYWGTFFLSFFFFFCRGEICLWSSCCTFRKVWWVQRTVTVAVTPLTLKPVWLQTWTIGT